MSTRASAQLTLGPLLFHWPATKRRDFYLRIADEAPVDIVYLGEVVCSKREASFEPFLDEVAERLKSAGKTVVLSTLALVTSKREVAAIRERVARGWLLEANDVACVQILGRAAHVVGPYINVVNEAARDFLRSRGAIRIALPVELPAASICTIAATSGATSIEVHTFGRQPLSVAMRCYHARSHNLTKDHCQLVCSLDADGLTAATVDGMDILTINGTQTLSHGYGVLLAELASLRDAGVTHFRLSPHDIDMVRVAEIYRDVLDGRQYASDALQALRHVAGNAPFINGFMHGREGMAWV